MWGVAPYESVWSVEVTDGNWIKRMGDSVQSGFQIFLPIFFDVNALSIWKPAKIDKGVDERWIIARVSFPLDHRAVVPGFAIVTGVSPVLVALTVRKQCEAWKRVLWHLGQAVLTQELHHSS